MMKAVKIYTTEWCGFCHAAKKLLRSKGIEFDEIDVGGDAAKRAWLLQVTGQRTVPQVFIGERPYGGYTDIVALERQGELDRLLGLRGQ